MGRKKNEDKRGGAGRGEEGAVSLFVCWRLLINVLHCLPIPTACKAIEIQLPVYIEVLHGRILEYVHKQEGDMGEG